MGLIVYVNGGAYLLAEEWHMIISHLNNLKDREEAEAKAQREADSIRAAAEAQAQREVAAAREQAEEQGRRDVAAARQETISAVAAARQQLTAEELENLPPAMRELLNRYSGDNSNGSDNGAGGR